MLALGAAPAHAGSDQSRSWAGNPLLNPFEKVLADKIEKAPDPFASPTKVIAFHVGAEKKGAVPAPKQAAKPAATKPVPANETVAKALENVKPEPQPRPRRRLPRATPSFYVHYTSDSVMRERGCRAGAHRAFGIVILAFGKPYYNGHSYGTLLFSGWFASNQEITHAMKTFARAYVDCLPKGSAAHIALARGTSNYFTSIPSHYSAGWKWARETVLFARWLRKEGLTDRVTSAAAIDAEPAWNPSFTRTRDFFRGYRAYGPGHVLYNYGSLDGGVGTIWNEHQVYYVSARMKYARMIPEIYYPVMARQWATMSRIAVERYGKPIKFAGVLTQHKAQCGCGFKPKEAHQALVLALREHPKTWVRRLPALTNIKSN
jgi:hypothetical protein